jgi:hypothetical protein
MCVMSNAEQQLQILRSRISLIVATDRSQEFGAYGHAIVVDGHFAATQCLRDGALVERQRVSYA